MRKNQFTPLSFRNLSDCHDIYPTPNFSQMIKYDIKSQLHFFPFLVRENLTLIEYFFEIGLIIPNK